MKIKIAILMLLISTLSFNIYAQKDKSGEAFGGTLNLGLGIGGYAGYYGYIPHPVPVFHADYEFGVARDFTLAPSISVYTFRESYYWGNPNHPYQYYYYHETVIPIGVKGTYYFDRLLHASNKWDFYAAATLGFAIVSSGWDNGYEGDRNYYHNASPLFLDLHLGTEYHINNRIGLFFDLSTGVSTIGIALH